MRVMVLVALIACSSAPKRSAIAPIRPTVNTAPLPPGFSLDVVVALKPSTPARLRLDEAGRPYLITADALVPVQRLPSGETAKPFKIRNATPIGDVTWADDGVMLIVVGAELGVIRERGFQAILQLPQPGMRVVRAAAERVWLFAPDDAEGRLYLYDKAGMVSQLLRAGLPIRAVSGTPDRVYVAVGTTLLRITDTAVDIVFDGSEDIVAIAATPAGVFVSLASGTFFRTDAGAISRLTKNGALAIESRGDDVYMHLDALGVIRGAPVSAFANVTVAADVAATPVDMPGPRRRLGARRKAAIGVGVGSLALFAVGVGYALSAHSSYDDAHASGHCNAATVCDDVGFMQVEDAYSAARVSTITTLSGAALAGVAVALWLTGVTGTF